MLSLFSQGVAAPPGGPGRWDSTTFGLVTRAAWAAGGGDTASARRLLATVRSRPAPDIALAGMVVTTLLVGAFGVLSSLDVLRRKPLSILRAE